MPITPLFFSEAGRFRGQRKGESFPEGIEHGDDTFFIRLTGGDVETTQTLRFDVEKKTVRVADRAKGER